jgi:uncharacterized protein (TIGR02246 family)
MSALGYTAFMARFLWLLLAVPLFAASPEAEIRKVLDDQTAAWNRGDVRGFMEGYDKSESTTFVGTSVTKGFAQVLANYEKNYPTREKMGTLKFSEVEIRHLSPDYASVIGRFHLDRTTAAGGDTGGIFTLLFHKLPVGWRIILDHTH